MQNSQIHENFPSKILGYRADHHVMRSSTDTHAGDQETVWPCETDTLASVIEENYGAQ